MNFSACSRDIWQNSDTGCAFFLHNKEHSSFTIRDILDTDLDNGLHPKTPISCVTISIASVLVRETTCWLIPVTPYLVPPIFVPPDHLRRRRWSPRTTYGAASGPGGTIYGAVCGPLCRKLSPLILYDTSLIGTCWSCYYRILCG